MDEATGLTKLEAAAIAIRAGLAASGDRTPSESGPDGVRRPSPAEYAVREADALFDELDGDKT